MRSRSGSSFRRSVGVVLAAFSVLAASSGAGAIALVPDDTYEFAEDSAKQFLDVLLNDEDGSSIVDYDETGSLGGKVGEARDVPGGPITELTYTPAANAAGDDQFTYTTTTTPGGPETVHTVIVTLTPVADAPVALASEISVTGGLVDGELVDVTEDGPAVDVTAQLLANFSDGDGDTLTIVFVSDSSYEFAAVLDDGSVTYEAKNQVGTTDQFSVSVSDGDATTPDASASVSVTIIPQDDAPEAAAGTAPAAEGATSSIDVAVFTSDVDGGENTFAIVTAPAHGTAEIDADSGEVSYTHNGDENTGEDAFEYSITGGDPEAVSAATVTVEISEVDDDPIAEDDESTVEEGKTVSINVLDNDTDVDGYGEGPADGVDPFAVVSVTQPDPVNGSVAINETTGFVDYTHTESTLGEVEFNYTLAGDPGSTATVLVIVTNGDDDAPDVTAPVGIVVDEDAVDPVSIEILTPGQTDLDGSLLSIVGASNGGFGGTSVAGGTVEYMPYENANGEDSFTVTITDGDSQGDDDLTITVNVEITAVNDAPVAVEDEFTVPEDSDAFFLDLLDNDTDVDGYDPNWIADDIDPQAVVSVSELDESIGTLAIVAGGVEFTPVADYFGDFQFTYTLAGDPGSTATVSVEVENVDDAPDIELSRGLPLDEDAPGPHAVEVLADGQTDADGSLLTFVEDSLADLDEVSHGEASIVGGQFQYVPNENANGTDTFTLTVTDGDGGDDDVTVTVTVVITAVNDAPAADDDFYAVNEDAVSSLDVLDGDTDVDDDKLSVDPASLSLDAEIGALAVVEGAVEFIPAENYFGSFTFTYDVVDGDPEADGTLSDSGKVSVTVRNLEDPLVANPDNDVVDEDDVVYVDVLGNDVDVDETGFELVDFEQPDGGFVALSGDALRVEPDPDFNGTLEIPYGIRANAPVGGDFFFFGSCDLPFFFGEDGDIPGCETVWGLLTVEVGGVNDRPDANQDSDVTDEDTPVTIDILANDTDSDPGDVLVIDRVGNAQIGTVEIADNKILYTPNQNANGSDSFIYYVSDGSLLSVALVSVSVTPVNDAPTITGPELVETDEDTEVSFDVVPADIDSETLTVSLASEEVSGGVVSIAGNKVTFVPTEHWFGETSVEVTVTDGEYPVSVIVPVTVTPVNDVPVAEDLALNGFEDTPVLGTVVAADVEDTDAATMTYEVTTDPNHGSVVMTGAGFEYTPNDDYNGEDSFEVTVTDTDELNPGTDFASVSILLEAVNDAPTITGPELVETDEDTEVSFDVVPADIDSETLTVSLASEEVSGGVVSIAGNKVTFVPTEHWFGETSVEVTVTDGEYPVSVIVPITVTPVNDLPVALPAEGPFTGAEDTDLLGTVVASDVEDDAADLTYEAPTETANGSVVMAGADFVYTPVKDFNGTDSFEVTVTDTDELNPGTAVVTVEVLITPVNDAPTLTGPELPVSTNEDTPVTFTVDVADIDSETLTVSVVDGSAVRGVATVEGTEVTFDPDPDWHGDSAVDVIVSDGDLSTEALTVPITVISVNDHPVLSAPAFELDEDSETTVTISVTDVEDDWAERDLAVEVTKAPSMGILEADGETFTYTGNPDANGTDNFMLSVTDFDGDVAQVLVPVKINPVNDAPTLAKCDGVTVETGSQIAIDGALCGADIDGDVLTVADGPIVSNNGTVVIEDGMIVFAPADGYIGTTAVGFFLTDGTDSVETSIAVEVTEKVNPYIGTAGKDGQLVRIYSAMLGRLPDAKGFNYWSAQLEDGMTIQQLIRYFGTSDEFLNTYGDRLVSDSDADWIEFVYNEILERPSDAKGRAYWTGQLAGGLSRANMVTFFAESSEYKTQTQTL